MKLPVEVKESDNREVITLESSDGLSRFDFPFDLIRNSDFVKQKIREWLETRDNARKSCMTPMKVSPLTVELAQKVLADLKVPLWPLHVPISSSILQKILYWLESQDGSDDPEEADEDQLGISVAEVVVLTDSQLQSTVAKTQYTLVEGYADISFSVATHTASPRSSPRPGEETNDGVEEEGTPKAEDRDTDGAEGLSPRSLSAPERENSVNWYKELDDLEKSSRDSMSKNWLSNFLEVEDHILLELVHAADFLEIKALRRKVIRKLASLYSSDCLSALVIQPRLRELLNMDPLTILIKGESLSFKSVNVPEFAGCSWVQTEIESFEFAWKGAVNRTAPRSAKFTFEAQMPDWIVSMLKQWFKFHDEMTGRSKKCSEYSDEYVQWCQWYQNFKGWTDTEMEMWLQVTRFLGIPRLLKCAREDILRLLNTLNALGVTETLRKILENEQIVTLRLQSKLGKRTPRVEGFVKQSDLLNVPLPEEDSVVDQEEVLMDMVPQCQKLLDDQTDTGVFGTYGDWEETGMRPITVEAKVKWFPESNIIERRIHEQKQRLMESNLEHETESQTHKWAKYMDLDEAIEVPVSSEPMLLKVIEWAKLDRERRDRENVNELNPYRVDHFNEVFKDVDTYYDASDLIKLAVHFDLHELTKLATKLMCDIVRQSNDEAKYGMCRW